MPDAGGSASSVAIPLSPRTFDRVRKLVYGAAGIDLRPGKESLVSARLVKLMRRNGHATFEECIEQAEADSSGESLIALIDVLTTNYTSFMREASHFDFLAREILPKRVHSGRIDLWCAAASTGEEPYSLAFTVLESLGQSAAGRCRILATDISTQALATARAGVYPMVRMQGLPAAWLSRYFLKGEGESLGYCKVKPEVARMVEFRRLNLVEPFDPQGVFPLISCRNVMIYFDRPTQARIVERMSRFLEPGGHLFVGLSESLSGIEHRLQYVKPAIYRRSGAGLEEATARWK